MKGARFAPYRFVPSPDSIADQLRQCLLALDYPAFARSVCVLLGALGYEDVRPSGRQEWKGYNRPGGGGYDLEASLPGGLVPRRVVAQIKQYDTLNVHQRNADELLGACLRSGAAEAILVTTSSFSKVVQHSRSATSDAAEATNGWIAPVRLIDGRELLGLMIRYRIGISERYECGVLRLAIDETFFRAIVAGKDSESKGNLSSSASAATLGKPAPLKSSSLFKSPAVPMVHLTIHISARSCSVRPGGRQGKDGLAKGGR